MSKLRIWSCDTIIAGITRICVWHKIGNLNKENQHEKDESKPVIMKLFEYMILMAFRLTDNLWKQRILCLVEAYPIYTYIVDLHMPKTEKYSNNDVCNDLRLL
jgi:hypothetical protein